MTFFGPEIGSGFDPTPTNNSQECPPPPGLRYPDWIVIYPVDSAIHLLNNWSLWSKNKTRTGSAYSVNKTTCLRHFNFLNFERVAVLTGDRINELFYKKMYNRFARPRFTKK